MVARLARALLGEVDTSGGVRLLGVGVSGLADWIQEDLFADYDDEAERGRRAAPEEAVAAVTRRRQWAPGMDVVHAEHGPGWVWGSGVGRVTVRFETAETRPRPGAHVPRRRPRPRAAAPRPLRRAGRQRRVNRTCVPRPQLRALPQVVAGRTTATTG